MLALRISSGTASDLTRSIREATHAVVYVDAPWSTYAVVGRRKFLDAALNLSQSHASLGVQFFLIRDEDAPDCQEWVNSLRDDRVFPLGTPLGCGGIIWLECGRVMDADPYGGNKLTDQEMVRRTRDLWREGA
jgi:hypothetical protein